MTTRFAVYRVTSLAVAALAAIAFYGCRRPVEKPLEPLTFRSLGVAVDSLGIDRIASDLVALPLRAFNPDADSAPYDLYLTAAIVDPESVDRAFRSVQSQLDTHCSGASLYWPVTASPVDWALPLADAAMMTGDRTMARNGRQRLLPLLNRDIATQLDTATMLFRGASPAFSGECLPDASRMAAMRSFAANSARLAALRFAAGEYGATRFAGLADSLETAIATLLWDPAHNRFHAGLFGAEYPVAGGVAPSVAESAAVISGTVSGEAARRLVASTPAPVGDYNALAYRAVAACRVGNEEAFVASFAPLIDAFGKMSSDHIADLVLGVMLRGVFRISPQPDALGLAPFVPSEFPSEIHLEGLRYRDAIFDITLNGHGDIISTFTIDGTVCDTPTLPADLTGHHQVKVTLVGFSDPDAHVVRSEHHPAPSVPEVSIDGSEAYVQEPNSESVLNVFVDGELLMQTADSIFNFPKPDSGNLVFTVTDPDGLTSEPTAPLIYYSDNQTITIPVDKLIRPGATNLLRDRRIDRKVARSFVESSRFRHPDIRFDVTPSAAGRYYLQVEFLDGLGIVNPDRRYAVRRLYNGDTDLGLIIFDQQPPESWSPQVKWWERRGLTDPIPVDLHPGTNHLTLRYFAIPGLPDDANTILPTTLHLTPAH